MTSNNSAKWANTAISTAFLLAVTYGLIDQVREVRAINHLFNNAVSDEQSIEYMTTHGYSREEAERYPSCFDYYTHAGDKDYMLVKRDSIKENIHFCIK